MARKTLVSCVMAASLTVMLSAASAYADPKNSHRHHHGERHVSEHGHDGHKHSDTGIALAIGAAALIAAVAAAKTHENSESYGYHHGASDKDNAVSACVHKAHRRTVRRGGYGVTLRRVLYANPTNNGWNVAVRVKQRMPRGAINNRATCAVSRGHVKSFAWN